MYQPPEIPQSHENDSFDLPDVSWKMRRQITVMIELQSAEYRPIGRFFATRSPLLTQNPKMRYTEG